MLEVTRLDPSLALDPATEHEGHRQYPLERVALASTSPADVRFARRDPDVVINDGADGLGRNPGTVVLDDDTRRFFGFAGPDRDLNYWRDVSLLAGVDAVVDQLFDDDARPLVG